MSTVSLVTMVVICGLVWGSFGTLLVTALRKEGQRKQERDVD